MPPIPAQYGINNLVLPGLPKYLSGRQMTDRNHLRDIGATKPEMLPGLFHWASTTFNTPLMRILAFMNLSNARKAGKMDNFMKNGEDVTLKFKGIGNYEASWRVANPDMLLFNIVEAPQPVNGTIGLGGVEFTMVVSPFTLYHNEMLISLGGMTDAIVLKITNVVEQQNGKRITCFWNGAGPNASIPASRVAVGTEWKRSWNEQPEASFEGSTYGMTFGDVMRTAITTSRYEYGMTGHAMATKLNPGNCEWLVFNSPTEGKLPFWISHNEKVIMANMMKNMEEMIIFGVSSRDQLGNWRKDPRGYDILAGDGLLRLMNARNHIQYRNVNSALFDRILETFYFANSRRSKIIIFPGAKLRVELSKFLAAAFGYSPEVMYIEPNSGEFDIKVNGGIDTRFNLFRHELGDIYICSDPFYDINAYPQSYLPGSSTRRLSDAAMIFDVTPMQDSKGNEVSPLELINVDGRSLVVKDLNGMAGTEKNIATPLDIWSRHFMTSGGVVARNNNGAIILDKIQ